MDEKMESRGTGLLPASVFVSELRRTESLRSPYGRQVEVWSTTRVNGYPVPLHTARTNACTRARRLMSEPGPRGDKETARK
jgi:hypothetical protein